MSEKDELCGAPAAIGMVVLALLFGGVVLAIFPGWNTVIEFCYKDRLSILDDLFSLFLGVVSGLYSGVIVSRINRFSSLKSEVLNSFNNIDYLAFDDREKYLLNSSIKKIRQIANDFFRFGHFEAGEITLYAASELDKKLQILINGEVDEDLNLESLIDELRLKMRRVRYSKKIFLPFGDV